MRIVVMTRVDRGGIGVEVARGSGDGEITTRVMIRGLPVDIGTETVPGIKIETEIGIGETEATIEMSESTGIGGSHWMTSLLALQTVNKLYL